MTSSSGGGAWRDRQALSATVVFAVLTFATTWPLARDLSGSLAGDYGDPLFVTWVMAWVGDWVTSVVTGQGAGSLWDAGIFHPEPGALAFSEHFFAPAVMTLPVRWLGGGAILAYNAAFLLSFVLSGLGAFLLARALSGRAIAGWVAGLLFAFNQYRLTYELAHLHVLSIQFLPFALYGLHRYIATDSRKALAWGAVALVALNLSSGYYMLYCAPVVGLFVLAELARLGRFRELRVWLELWAAAAFVALASLPFVLPYLAMRQREGFERAPEEVVRFSATVDHYVAALPALVPALALVAVGLVAACRPRVAARGAFGGRGVTVTALLLLLLAVWLSLGPVVQYGGAATGVPGLYGVLYEHVPGFDGLRVPARYAMLVFLFLGLLAGEGAAVLAGLGATPGFHHGLPGRAGAAAAAVLAGCFVWMSWPAAMPVNQPLPSPGLAPAPAYLTPAPRPPAIYQRVAALPEGSVLVELPFGDPWYELRYMFFSIAHGHPLLNGYSGVFPRSYEARRRVLREPYAHPDDAWAAISGATHAVVHPTVWPDDSGTLVAAWLESFGARLIDDADGALLYEIPTEKVNANLLIF